MEITNVNKLAERIIQSRKFRKSFYNRSIHDNYNYEDVEGTLNSETLSCLIKKAKSNRKVESILSELLDFADSDSITYDNFNQLLIFPGKHRDTMLSKISYLDLPFLQMLVLNCHPLSMRPLYYIITEICQYPCFTKKDLAIVLIENCDLRLFALRDAMKWFEQHQIVNEKTQLIEYLLDQVEEDDHETLVSDVAKKAFSKEIMI